MRKRIAVEQLSNYDVILELNPAICSENSILTLQPEGVELECEYNGDSLWVQLPKIEGYSILDIRLI